MPGQRTVYDVQLDFAICSAYNNQIIWDSLSAEQSHGLKEKINILIPGEVSKNAKIVEQMRNDLFKSVWQQRKFSNGVLLSSIIYVMVTEEADHALARQSTRYSCHFVFRTRKCLNDNKDSSGCCMIFVDEHARIYSNWQEYVKNNKLPKGTMVAPANGVYSFTEHGEVILELHPTPASSVRSKILSTTDSLVSAGGLVATVPVAAALVLPVAAPLMCAATAVTLSASAYATLRSICQLDDRRKRGQSMNLKNREARRSWLGVTGGVIGLGAAGATKALTYAAGVGQEISMATKVAVNGLNVSSMLLSGTGVASNVYDLYLKIQDDETVSSMDVLQLASSLIVFTHSINNYRLASKIVTNSKTSSSLGRLKVEMRQRLDQLANPRSNAGRGLDIMRTLNEIPLQKVLTNINKLHGQIKSGDYGGFASTIIQNSGLSNIPLAEHVMQRISNMGTVEEILIAMATCFSNHIVKFFLNLCETFLKEMAIEIDAKLSTYISTDIVLYKMFTHCLQNYVDLSYEYLESKTGEILRAIENYFDSLNPNSYDVGPQRCPQCKGQFYISKS